MSYVYVNGFGNVSPTGNPQTYLDGYGFIGNAGTASTAISQPASGPVNVSAVTGVNPVETSYSLYGHTVPLSVFGVGRIGGEIISGPWINNGLASFIISFGVPADPSGTRILREIAFDSEVIWTGSLTGAGTPSSSGFSTEQFTVRFYDGKLTQSADALETANFGADAVAYRPQILLAFENLPLAATKFGKIPYVAAVIADTSGDDVNLGEAFERLAYSPWVQLTSANFETSGITDGLPSGGLIFADNIDFLQAMQLYQRFYPTWDILQTDKLRIVDRGVVTTPDFVLDGSTLTGSVSLSRQGADQVAKDLVLSTIDNGADYTIVAFTATLPRDPVSVTSSVATESVYLPSITDAATRASLATFAKYQDELARTSVSGTSMIAGLQIEPGARVAITGLGDFPSDIFRIEETTHGLNYTIEFAASPYMRCSTVIPAIPTVWNHLDRSAGIGLSDADLTATLTATGHNGVRSTNALTGGKVYFEILLNSVNNSLGGGWNCGVANMYETDPSEIVANAESRACVLAFFNGDIFPSGSFGGSVPVGTVVSMAFDLSARLGWFRLDAGNWNNSGTANPATAVGGIDFSSIAVIGGWRAFFGRNVAGESVTANFGASAFAHTVPGGFSSWDSLALV